MEAEEALHAFRQTGGQYHAAQPLLLDRWAGPSRRAPCPTLDPPAVWSEVGTLREWCLAQGSSTDAAKAAAWESSLRLEAQRLRHGVHFWSAAAHASLRRRETDPAVDLCWKRGKAHYEALSELVQEHGAEAAGGPPPDYTSMQLRFFAARSRVLLERRAQQYRRHVVADDKGEGAEAERAAAAVVKPVWKEGKAAQVLVAALQRLHGLERQEQVAVLEGKAEWMGLAYAVAKGSLSGDEGTGRRGGPLDPTRLTRAMGQHFLQVWPAGQQDADCFGHSQAELQALVRDPTTLRRAWLRCAHGAHLAGLQLLSGGQQGQGMERQEEAARASARFAAFCDALVQDHGQRQQRGQQQQASDLEAAAGSPLSAPALAAQAVEHYLRALALAPEEASPAGVMRIVDLVRSSSAVGQAARSALAEGSGRVPPWAFLPVVNQLLAGLDAGEAQTVLPLLERMARDYPQALFFPYRVRVVCGDY